MEITGKVVKLKPIETFQSGFQKRTVVVKTAEQYPQELPIDFLKDAVDKLVDISEGSNVKVGVNLKGNRYTNAKGEEVNTVSLVGWFINATDGASTPNAHDSFGHEKKNKAKAKTKDFSPFDDEDDQDSLPI